MVGRRELNVSEFRKIFNMGLESGEERVPRREYRSVDWKVKELDRS